MLDIGCGSAYASYRSLFGCVTDREDGSGVGEGVAREDDLPVESD